MQPNTFFSLFLLGLAVAVVGYVAKTELMAPGMMLSPYFNWLSKAVGPEAKKRRDWLYKPLGGCLACLTGQLALWAYLLPRHWQQWHLPSAAFVVCVAIFAATQYDHFKKA